MKPYSQNEIMRIIGNQFVSPDDIPTLRTIIEESAKNGYSVAINCYLYGLMQDKRQERNKHQKKHTLTAINVRKAKLKYRNIIIGGIKIQ